MTRLRFVRRIRRQDREGPYGRRPEAAARRERTISPEAARPDQTRPDRDWPTPDPPASKSPRMSSSSPQHQLPPPAAPSASTATSSRDVWRKVGSTWRSLTGGPPANPFAPASSSSTPAPPQPQQADDDDELDDTSDSQETVAYDRDGNAFIADFENGTDGDVLFFTDDELDEELDGDELADMELENDCYLMNVHSANVHPDTVEFQGELEQHKIEYDDVTADGVLEVEYNGLPTCSQTGLKVISGNCVKVNAEFCVFTGLSLGPLNPILSCRILP